MFGIDPRAARAAWTVFLLALLIAAAYAIREILAVFVIALLFGYLLMPLVGFVARITPPQVSPKIALGIVYLALIGAIIGLGLTLGTRLVNEAGALASQLPALLKNPTWMNKIPLPSWLEPARQALIERIRDQLSTGGQQILPYIEGVGGHLISGAKYALFVILIPILAFFFLKDGTAMRDDFVAAFVDERRRPVVDNILADINVLLGEYIRALVLLSLSSFTAHSLFLGISGAPFAILLSGVAAVGEFIPVIGPLAAGLVIILVTSIAGYSHVLLYVIFWGCFRMAQDYVFSPYLMSRGAQLSPLLVLFGVFAGDQIAGVIGMFLSVPALAILRVMFVRLRRSRASDLIAPRVEI